MHDRRGEAAMVAVSLVVTLVATGCSEGIQQRTYRTTGTVVFDGKPLSGATLVFHAVDKSNFRWKELPQAFTDMEGSFSVRTYGSDDGAPAGAYDVGIAMITPIQDEGEDQRRRVKGLTVIPQKYADPKTSGIRVTVAAKTTVIPTIRLTP